MPSDQKTRIPYVPIRDPPFQGPQGEGIRWSYAWIIFFERLMSRLGLSAGGEGELKATFSLNRNINITATSFVPQPFIAKDLTEAHPFRLLRVAAYVPPTGQAARLNIDISKDEGSTWNTIFAAPGYVELADGDDTRQDFSGVFVTTTYGSIEDGDFLRVNFSQVGSTIAGKNIEIVLWFDEAP